MSDKKVLSEEEIERKYANICQSLESIIPVYGGEGEIAVLNRLKREFNSIIDWKDSAEKVEICDQLIKKSLQLSEKIEEKQQAVENDFEAKAAAAKKRQKIWKIIVNILSVATAAVITYLLIKAIFYI